MGGCPEWQSRTESRRTPPLAPRLGYIPALDGLRAVAVIAVLLYHGDQAWIPGGFLGVDVFFVISGYLITCLLLADCAAERRRRAQALLVPPRPTPPARAVHHALRGVAVRDRCFLPDVLDQLRGEVIAALLYVENWFLIFRTSRTSERRAARRCSTTCGRSRSRSSSTSSGRSSSCSCSRCGARAASVRSIGVLAGVAVSTLEMAILYHPYIDPSRVYYGTDTRVVGTAARFRAGVRVGAVALVGKTGRSAGIVLDAVACSRCRAVLDVPQRGRVRPRSCTAAGSWWPRWCRRYSSRRWRTRRLPASCRGCWARGVPLGRRPVVLHLPVALADLHGDPPPFRRAVPGFPCSSCGSR